MSARCARAMRLGAKLVRGARSAAPTVCSARLAGRPIEIDGQRLDPEVQLLIRLMGRGSASRAAQIDSVAEARAERAREAHVVRGRRFDGGAHRGARRCPGPAGPLAARLYVPDRSREREPPLLVFFHGGAGSCAISTPTTTRAGSSRGRRVCSCCRSTTGSRPSIPSRQPSRTRSPPSGSPREHAAELGADPHAVAVGGDSAGGNLAAVVSQLAVAEGGPVARLYLDDLSGHRPLREAALIPACSREGFVLTEEHMDWYRGHYLPDRGRGARPARFAAARRRPLRACRRPTSPRPASTRFGTRARNTPCRLREAGVPVALSRHPGLVHGFLNAVGSTRFGRLAMQEAVGALRMGCAGAQLGSRPSREHLREARRAAARGRGVRPRAARAGGLERLHAR